MPKTSQEGVITVYNEENELVAIVKKDEVSRKNVFYSVSEMGFEEIGSLIEGKLTQAKKI